MARTEADRLTLAVLSGVVGRRVQYRELTVQEKADAIAEIRTVTTRPDLLAEEAGLLLGVGPSRAPLEVDRHERMAELLIEAFDLDLAEVEKWAAVGRKRAEDAQAIPYTGARAQ